MGSTIYYDGDSEFLEECVITICPKGDDFFGSTTESPDSTTQSSDSKQLTTVKLTPLERKQKRLKEVQLAIKQIQTNLTTMCWETSLGQELSKVIVFDGVSAITVVPLFAQQFKMKFITMSCCYQFPWPASSEASASVSESI